MHFSLLEKSGAAILICAWLIYGSMAIGNMLVHVAPLETPAIAVAAVTKGGAEPAAPADAGPPVDFKTLMASADPAAGEKVFGKCKSCHGVEKGGPNKVGPNLWGVVGGPTAHKDDFSYSAGLAGKHGTWTYDDLNAFLTSPKDYIPGTKMSFAGLSKAQDRANVIAYLRSNADNPPPLP